VVNTAQRVGVVIVNYNSGALLEQCLNALASQTRLADRIVIVDNASDDGSEQAVARILNADALARDFRQSLSLQKLDSNYGFARANNLAVAELHDVEWIVTLNPDAFAASDWLQKLLETSLRNPSFDFFGCKMLSENSTTLDGVGDIYHSSGLVWRADHGVPVSDRNLQECEIFSPCAAAAMYRRRCWLEAGGLDERYFCYVEDVDLGFRLRLLGYRCWYAASAEVIHIGSAVSGSHSDFTVYHGHRNLVWTYLKNMPSPLFWIYLPQHLLLNIATIAGFCLRGQVRPVLRAKGHALLRLPEFWSERRRIQQTRRVDSRAIRGMLTRGVSPLLNRRYRYQHPDKTTAQADRLRSDKAP